MSVPIERLDEWRWQIPAVPDAFSAASLPGSKSMESLRSAG